MIDTMDLLKELNEPQKKAVLHTEGPLLVVAGAGAGKTKVITHRIANLIKNGVQSEQILAVTFTNKAANEMKERIFNLLKLDFQKEVQLPTVLPTVGTFHSICARILRQNGRAVGLPRNFSIINKEGSLKLLKKGMKSLEINPKQFQPSKMLAIISRQKSELVKLNDFIDSSGADFFPNTLARIWEEYEKILKNQKSVDFDDLIRKTVFLFQDRPDILENYQNKWSYLLIDEYQDTNRSQYIFSKLLAKKSKNICVVGDEDQSIYKFRGADFGNILKFEKDWPNVTTVILEQNYRSTQNILEAANAVIKRNRSRKEKKLFSELKKGQGLTIFDAPNERDEADFIALSSKELITNGFLPKQIAVLYRANFQSRVIEEAFLKNDIPYQVVGTKFFDRKEIKDIVAYIKTSLNPNDILSFERIINEPPRGLGKITLMNYLANKKLTPDKQDKINKFLKLLEKTKKIIQKENLSKVISHIIKSSGYEDYLNDGSEEGMMRLDNLKELLVLSVKYDKLKAPLGTERFLEDVALLSDQDNIKDDLKNSTGAVRLMTIHTAKGLEFSNVFLTGLEEGLFPYIKFGEADETEEERRLFYVAITRAKEKLFLSFAYSRNLYGGRQVNKPSKFINEIPQELFDDFEQLPTTNYLEL